jgi:hypothetical protein
MLVPLAETNATLFDDGREQIVRLQKGGVPAAPSGTATLLRLSPSRRFYPNSVFNLLLQVSPTPMA